MKKRVAVIGTIAALCLLSAYLSRPRTDPHSGWRDQGSIYWNGTLYVACTGDYREGRTIGRTADKWDINEVEEDPSHTFVVARSFLDQYLFVREDYELPAGAAVTAAFLHRETVSAQGFTRTVEEISDEAFCRAWDKLFTGTARTLTYGQNDGELKILGHLSLSCENCPLAEATVPVGDIGILNGRCIIISPYTQDYGLIPEVSVELLRPYLE